jgi:exodeoxyribonuclease VII large subunit
VLETAAQRTDAAARRLVHPAARLQARRVRLHELALRLNRSVAGRQAALARALDAQRLRLARELREPARRAPQLAALTLALTRSARRGLDAGGTRIAALAQNLEHLNPRAVLERGYAIVTDAEGDVVTDAGRLAAGDEVALTLARGRAGARITALDDTAAEG